MARQYCEHHCHGEYSLLDGTGVAEDYAARAAALGYTHLNKTEHGTIAGLLHHTKACHEVGIIPVNGMEAYFKPDRFVQDTSWQNDPTHFKREFHLTITANSLKGWQNLIKLSSLAWIEGFYGRPCLDYELLEKYGDGITISSACIASYLSQALLAGDEKSAKYFTDRIRKAVDNRFYIELMPHDWDEQRRLNILLANFALKEGIPLLATNDVHYPTAEYAPVQKVLMMCSTGMTNTKKKAKNDAGEQVYGDSPINTLYLMNGDEIYEQFATNHPDIPDNIVEEAIRNTVDITKEFKPYIINKDYKVPKAINDDKKAKDALREWSFQGLNSLVERWRGFGHTEEEINDKIVTYTKRINYELEIFTKLDVYHYMVLIADLVRWAKSTEGITPGTTKEPMRVGLGRGSAAGSLVSFLVGITGVDPIAWGLLFERFINPERHGLPDIDIDFDSDRREEVKQYTIAKYGADKVATVSTKSTFAAKAVIQRISKVYDDVIPFSEAMEVTNEVEKTEKSLKGILEAIPKAKEFAEKYPEPWKIMELLEDQVAGDSKHASAVIITDRPLLETMPLESREGPDKKGPREIVTAWTDSANLPIIAEYGYLKADFLATKGVTKIEQATQEVRVKTGDSTFEPNDMECLINPDAFEEDVIKKIFADGNTLGVFQFNSGGMTKFLKELTPDTLEHIVAANALFRPGPIAFIGDFVKRRHNRSGWDSWSKKTDEIVDPTYGIMLYQEQVMLISQAIGNFTAGEADSLRKAIGKLYRLGKEEAKKGMNEFKEKWDRGVIENGIGTKIGEEIWDAILEFAGYGFNKSHSVCYGIQGYQDAWLKYHHPKIFYKVLLSREPELVDQAIEEAKNFGVTISPPDINNSEIGFKIDDETDSLIYGLTAVADVGLAAAKPIVDERAANGPFTSLDDFLDRLPSSNAGSVKSLIWAGAFNNLGDSKQMLSNYIRHNKVVCTLNDGTKKSRKINGDKTAEFWMNKDNWGSIVDIDQIANLEHVITTASYVELYKDNQKLKKPLPFVLDSEPNDTNLYDWERQALGHNMVHQNPIYNVETQKIIDKYIDSPEKIMSTPSSKNLDYRRRDESNVQIAGVVSDYRVWKVKSGKNKGRHMANFTIRYYESEYKVTVFADSFEEIQPDFSNGDAVMILASKMNDNELSAKLIWKMDNFIEMAKNEK